MKTYSFEDGKYEFDRAESGLLIGARRNGEHWPVVWNDFQHSKVFHTILNRIDELESTPIDMVLHCPECGVQHIDAPERQDPNERDFGMTTVESNVWKNPPHRSHLCSACGFVWRPADVPTNGVKAIKTKGKLDDPIGPRHMETLLNGQVGDFFEGLGASDDVKAIQSAFRSIGLAEDTIKHILTVICRSKVAP